MPGLKPEQREGIWYAVGTFNGKRVRKSLGTRDEKTAQEQCALYEAKLWKRHSYGEEAVRTFEEAALSYMKQGGETRFLKKIIKKLKGRPLKDIAPGDIRDMAIDIYPTAMPATRNRQAIIPASAVINHAHSRKWCGLIRVELFPVAKPNKHKPVDDTWLSSFLAKCDKDGLPHLAALVLFMNQTAVRVSEALRVAGEHMDLGRRLCLLETTKTDEWVPCYLTAELVLRIAALEPKPGHPVFLYSDRSAVNRRIKAVCRRAKIEERSTHSVGRHSFGTNAIKEGVDVKKAMDAGRWKSARLFLETYVHSDEAGRFVADVFDRKRGPIGTELAQGKPKKRHHFGKKQ